MVSVDVKHPVYFLAETGWRQQHDRSQLKANTWAMDKHHPFERYEPRPPPVFAWKAQKMQATGMGKQTLTERRRRWADGGCLIQTRLNDVLKVRRHAREDSLGYYEKGSVFLTDADLIVIVISRESVVWERIRLPEKGEE